MKGRNADGDMVDMKLCSNCKNVVLFKNGKCSKCGSVGSLTQPVNTPTMLTAHQLQAISQKARRDKEAQIEKVRAKNKAGKYLGNQDTLRVIFPKISEAIEKIARQGWSSCGVEFPREDFTEKLTLFPNLQYLGGVGRLLFDEFRERGLGPSLAYELYDQPPEYSSALRVLFIVIIWDTEIYYEKGSTSHIDTLRNSIPLIHWTGYTILGNTRIEYPNKR